MNHTDKAVLTHTLKVGLAKALLKIVQGETHLVDARAFTKVIKRDDGFSLSGIPEFSFKFDAIEGFDYKYAKLSFMVEFSGCQHNEKTQDYSWDGSSYMVSSFIKQEGTPMDNWFDRPTIFGNRYKLMPISWSYIGVNELTDKENNAVTDAALTMAFNSLRTADKKTLLDIIFDKTNDLLSQQRRRQTLSNS